MTRLPTHLLVAALLRRTNDGGGLGVVRARGDAQAGGLLVLLDGGAGQRAVERGVGRNGEPALIDSTPADSIDDYWRRRRSRDPDLWVIELAGPDAQRFVVETMLDD